MFDVLGHQRRATMDDLIKLYRKPVPIFYSSRMTNPTQHLDIVKGVGKWLGKRGYRVYDNTVNPYLFLHRHKLDILGYFIFGPGGHTSPPEDWDYALGFASSNAGRRPVSLYPGLYHRGSNLGLVLGSVKISHIDIRTQGLDGMLREGTGLAQDILEDAARYGVKALKSTILPDSVWESLLFRAGRRPRETGFPWSRLALVDAAFRHDPELPAGEDYTAWRLYCAFAKACGRCTPLHQMDQKFAFYDDLDLAVTKRIEIALA